MDRYRTVKTEAQDEFIEKRSKFIGCCKPIATEDDAIAFINQKRLEHQTATHNVYAYILRFGQVRYSDDGEPSGTAGIPTLDVLQKSKITNVAVVVTRYFGGVLLGGGGLVRAYSHGAKIALEAGKIITMSKCDIANIRCSYSLYKKVCIIAEECGGIIDNSEFSDKVNIKLHITEEQFEFLNKKLTDATSGEIEIITSEKQYFEVT